jgi:hypothetical protein
MWSWPFTLEWSFADTRGEKAVAKVALVALILGIIGMLLGGGVFLVSVMLPTLTDGRTSWDEAMLGIIPGALILSGSFIVALVGMILMIVKRRNKTWALNQRGDLPPWLFGCEYSSYSAGYHFLTKPPAIERICPSSDPIAPPPTVLKDSDRLNWQRTILPLLTIGLLLVLDNRRTTLKLLIGFIALSIGIVGLMLFVLMVRLVRSDMWSCVVWCAERALAAAGDSMLSSSSYSFQLGYWSRAAAEAHQRYLASQVWPDTLASSMLWDSQAVSGGKPPFPTCKFFYLELFLYRLIGTWSLTRLPSATCKIAFFALIVQSLNLQKFAGWEGRFTPANLRQVQLSRTNGHWNSK